MADLNQIQLPNGGTYNFVDTEGRKEENLVWGGPSKVGEVSPIGMSLSNEHSANRLAYINGDSLYFEYSSNSGSTWTSYDYSASLKSQFCTLSYQVPIGRSSASTNYSTSSRTRITLTAQNGTTGYVYTNPRKMLINISSSGGMQVLVEYRTGINYQSSGSWSTFGTYNLSGWPGWNDIPLILGTLGGGTSQTNNNWQLRLTFIMTSFSSSYPTTAFVQSLRIYGENGWATTSNLGATGHLYSYDNGQNAVFPANVQIKNGKQVGWLSSTPTSGQVIVADGTGGGIKTTGYTIEKSVPSNAEFTDTQSDWNATSGKAQILNKPTIPTVNNGTLTIQKNGTSVATFTANQSGNSTANITVPTITDTYSGTSSDGMSGKAVKSAIDALDGTISGSAGTSKTLTAFSQTDGKVSATFGNISITKSQISDFPTIPTVNNGTLTLQKNGTAVGTFTANQSGNTTANFALYETDLKPLVHKTYASTSYYASVADWENSTWYFMSVKPDSWYKPWTVRFKVHSFCPSYSSYESITYVTISGRSDNYVYANWNERQNSAHQYTVIYPLKQAGFNAGYGHAIGISVLYADNYTNSAYYRTFEIDYFYCENCTVTLLDTPVKWSSWTGTGSTNYGSLNNMNATSRGLQESGDSDTTYILRRYYSSIKAGANKIFPYTLIMPLPDGRWESIVTSNSTGTSKSRNTHGFRLGQIMYMSANSTYNENVVVGNNNVADAWGDLFDHRYSFNTANNSTYGLTANKPVYLVGTVNASDGLFYLDSTWWTQTLPSTADGKLYIYLGDAYDYYRMNLVVNKVIYRYVNGMIRVYNQDAGTVNGHTVAKDVPSNAVFTDNNTTYTFANGTNGFTVTPSGGSAQTVTVTPSIANNVTGSGTSGYIAKFNGGNTITNGPQLGSSTTTFLRNDGQWATPAAGSDVNVTQTATSTSANYEVLFSATADNTTRTEGARKNNNLTFNPSTGILTTKHLSALFSGSKVYSEEVSACTTDSGGNWYPTVTLNGTNGAITATTLNGTTIGSSPKFTDANVTQTETSATVGTHEILFSKTGDNVTRTEGACKSQQFRYANAMSFTWTDWAGNQHTAQYVQPVGQLYIGTDTCILGNGYIYANANITVGSVNTNKVTCNSMSVQDISTNYTPAKTSGNWSIGSDDGVYRIHAYRTGNVVQLAIILHGNGSAVSAGANGFVGSISGGALPVDQVTLTGFYSSSSIMAVLDTDGSLTVRPFQNTTLSSSSRLYMTGTFICS